MCNKIDGASVEASLSAFDLDSIMDGVSYMRVYPSIFYFI
jgi:hypothetical protein